VTDARASWRRVKLGDVLRHDARPVAVEPERMYREIGIRSHGKGLFHKAPISGLELGDKRVFYVEPGDFVLNIVFAWEGAVGVVTEAERAMIASHRFPTFRAVADTLDLRFLEHFFHTPVGLELLGRVSPGGAGRNRTLNRTDFLRQELLLPPLPEQQRIVGKIDAARESINNARGAFQQQAQHAAQLLAATFHEVASAAPRVTLSQLAPLVRRPVEVRPGAQYLELGIRSFGKGTFHKPQTSGAALGDKRVYAVHPGDLLFSNVFAWEGAIAVAKPTDIGRIGSHRFMSCVSDQSIAAPAFLCYYFLSREGLSAVQAASPGGAGRNRTLGIAALGQLKVPMPTIAKQKRFSALVEEVEALNDVIARRGAELDALLPAILDRAFAGAL